MDRGKKYAAIKKGEAGERVTSKDQVRARVAIFECWRHSEALSVANGLALERLAAERAVLRASRSRPIEIGSFRLGFGSLSSALARAWLSHSQDNFPLEKNTCLSIL